MQLKFVLTVLASLVSVAVSTSVGSKSCKGGEFWWSSKGCCLPKGGVKTPPAPPKGSNCPPTSYYWEKKQGCCVPRNPPPSNPPPPQCPKTWTWYPSLYKCLPTPTPPTPPPSWPSHYRGNDNIRGNGYSNGNGRGSDNGNGNGNGHGFHRRDLKSRSTLCPTGLDACPVSGLTADYECLDTSTELESCGGCTSLGKGQDCTKIEGAWNVGCDQGSCIVYTCAGGFRIGADGRSCVPV